MLCYAMHVARPHHQVSGVRCVWACAGHRGLGGRGWGRGCSGGLLVFLFFIGRHLWFQEAHDTRPKRKLIWFPLLTYSRGGTPRGAHK